MAHLIERKKTIFLSRSSEQMVRVQLCFQVETTGKSIANRPIGSNS
jgi:hypothetical protein